MTVDIAVENIKRIMSALKIYDVQAPGISAELAAYSSAFLPLLERMDSILADAFIISASDVSLRRRESTIRAFGIAEQESPEVLRAQLLGRKSENSNLANDMNKYLPLCGIEGSIIENYSGGVYINVTDLKGMSISQAIEELTRFLPAQLAVYADFGGNSWGEIDSQELTYAEFDSADKTWEQLDNG